MASTWQEWATNNPSKMQANSAAAFTPAPMVVVPAPTQFSGPLSLQPQFDVIEALPPAAAERLRALRQRSADTHSIIPEFETIREASTARVEAENALKRLVAHPSENGFGLKDDDPRVITAQKHLDKMTADFARLRELREARTAQWQAASAALAACEDYLRHNVPGNCTLEDAEEAQPQLHKGESVIDGVERLRRRCREMRADLHRIQSAPYPSSHAKAQMRGIIEQLAMQGTASVSLLVEHDRREIGWPMTSLRSEVLGGDHPALAFAEVPDPVALTCWLHKDALIAALDREINTEADDKAALSHEARQKAEAETMSDLIAAEREESFFVWQAQAQGLPVEHRGDCSPQAIFGVALRTLPRADGLPPTTPRQSWTLRR